ncbi:MAG: ABC transporter permease, partial [Muribaculaceae bacterium]|nr:ABC transporter permease [Muribaculaceae bacterium]
FRSLVGEAMLITVAGWLIGCLLYVHYGMKEGLSVGIDRNNSYLPDGCWIVNFWEHFGIVSAAVLVVLAVIVLIGVSLPARRIARVNPVDAIRDE